MLIRKIQASDNPVIEQIIRSAIIEFKLPMTGTAFEDNETKIMYQSYQGADAIYFILEDNGQVVGGGGIQKLKGNKGNICELQKMYFIPAVRGQGYGKIIFNKCIEAAKNFGYSQCYLESAEVLKAALHIYEKNGFKHLDGPLGGTGHYSCGIWMLKELKE